MYGCDGIREGLHNTLVAENNILDKTDIYYSTIPVHSKNIYGRIREKWFMPWLVLLTFQQMG